MGQVCGKIPSSDPLRSSMMTENIPSPGFTVKLYSKPHEDFVEKTDEEVYVEDICKNVAKTLGLTARTFPLFGLVHASHKTWIGMHTKICPSKWEGGAVYFRIRFAIPDRKLQYLAAKEPEFIEYFYYQCRHDFLTDHFTNFYGKQIDKEKCFGLGVLERLIYARSNKIDPTKITSFKDSIPPAVRSEVTSQMNPLKTYKFNSSCRSQLLALNAEAIQNGSNLKTLWIRFISGIKKYIGNYLIETYDVQVQHRQGHVDRRSISVKPNEEIQCVGNFRDIWSVEIKQTPDPSQDPQWLVLICADGVPKVLLFEDEDVAESFVSLLIGYYRLTTSYYLCLMGRREPPSLKRLHKFCHGPLRTTHCTKSVREAGEGAYILRQSVVFDQLDLIYRDTDGSIPTLTIDCLPDGQFCFTKEPTKDGLVSLIKLDERTKHLAHPIPRKYNENYGTLLCLDGDPEDDHPSSNDLAIPETNHNVRFLVENEVTVTSRVLGSGYFTEVYDGNMVGKDRKSRISVAVKKLRDENRNKCLEPFLMTAHNMMQMKSLYIVELLGVCILPPVYMVLEYSDLGNLEKYLKDYPSIVSPPQRLQAMLCIMNALQHLAPVHEDWFMAHGNVRCKNILVFNHDNEFMVKLGDPGLTHLYNQLPLDHACNEERRPWLAPELLSDLKSITPQSDMYAFGTTVWEIWSNGAHPPDTFLQDLQAQRLPDSLAQTDTDSEWLEKLKLKVIEIMKSCHEMEPSDRNQLPQLLRDSVLLTVGADESRPYNLAFFETEITSVPLSSLSSNGTTEVRDSCNAPHLPVRGPNRRSSEGPVNPPSLENFSFEGGQWQIEAAKELGQGAAQPGQNQLKPTQSPPHLTNGHVASPNTRRPLPQRPKIEVEVERMIAKDRVQRGTIIGSGHFGMVYKGQLKQSKRGANDWIPCAVKTLKVDSQSCNDYDSVLKEEINIMCKLDHENVVKLYGFCINSEPEPYWLVMEYFEKGSLYEALKNSRMTPSSEELTPEILFTICNDVALGMHYLALKDIIHRDLAARNILLTKNYHAKITDFGLARMVDEKDYYRAKRVNVLPVHYFAPESLAEKTFTEKGDVWSYGILLWEIYTKGDKPALMQESPGVDLWDLLYRQLLHGKRLPYPQLCPRVAWELITEKCWLFKANDRANFEQIIDFLNNHRNWSPRNEPIQV